MALSRREVLRVSLAGAAAVGLGSRALGADGAATAAATTAPADLALPVLGKVKPVPGKAIAASPLGVGMETLDRRHYDPARVYRWVGELGVKWARLQTGWGRTETQRGAYDFAWLEEVVDTLRKLGVTPWFNLGYGNQLYSPGAPDEAAVGWAPVFDDGARAGWLAFTRRLAARFGDRVKHWEIWNEPNITSFWKPRQPSAEDYVGMVKVTAPEIRRLVPGAVIIGGALAGMPVDYLKACLDAGLAEHVDRISYHPYRAIPEKGYEAQIKEYRDLIAQRKKGVELWQGENGCPSQKGGAGALANLEWNELRQARWVTRRIVSDLKFAIEMTSYYHLVDLVGYRGTTNHKGLLRGTTYEPKPAYHAYQCLCALFDAQTRRTELALALEGEDADKAWTAGFVRQGAGLYAYWFPADLQRDRPATTVTVRVPVNKDAALAKPVLIDPLTSKVYQLTPARSSGTEMTFDKLPLLDHVLLITDAAVAGV